MAAARDPKTGLTPAQERFAQELAAGKDQSEAYRIAFPRSRSWKPQVVWAKASALANGRVRIRRAELAAIARDEAERKLRFGLPEAMAQADEAYRCARGFGQGGAMVSAVMLKSRLAGLLVAGSEPANALPLGLTAEVARDILEHIAEMREERAALPEPTGITGREPIVIEHKAAPRSRARRIKRH